MAGEHLIKITKRAKQLQKAHPKTAWQQLIKKAAAELHNGVKAVKKAAAPAKKSTSVGVVRRTPTQVHNHKKPRQMATPSKIPAHVAGTTKKKKHHSVSGVHGKGKLMHDIMTLVGSGLGGFGAAIIHNRIPGNDVVKGGLQAAIGLGVMHMSRSDKHPLIYGLGTGIGTAGLVNGAHATGMISGFDEMISGIFGDSPTYVSGAEYEHNAGLDQSPAYVGASNEEIDKWVLEGIPPQGANDW